MPPAQYAQLQKDLAGKQEELDALKMQNGDLSLRRASLEAQIEAQPIIPAWKQATSELSKLAHAPILAEDFADRRRNLDASISVAQGTITRMQKNVQQAEDQLAKTGEDTAVMKNQDEIQRLVRELAIREKGEADRGGVMSDQLRGQERDLRQRIADLAKNTALDAAANPSGSEADQDDLNTQISQFQLTETDRNRVGRLAAGHAKQIAEREDSRRQVDRLKQRIEKGQSEWDQLGQGEEATTATQVLKQVDSPASLVSDFRDATTQCDRQRLRCETTRSRLQVDLPLGQLAALRLPDSATVSQAVAKMDDCEKDLESTACQHEEHKRQLADDEASYEAMESDTHLPSQAALQEARKKRDEQLTKIDPPSVLATEDLDDLMQWVRRADDIVDQLRTHQKEVVEREQLMKRIRKSAAKVGLIEASVAQKEKSLTDAKEHWQSLWTALGITPQTPAAMRDWGDDHKKLVEQVEVLADSESAVEKAKGAIELATQQLARIVNEDDTYNDPGESSDPVATLLRFDEQAKVIAERQEIVQKRRDTLRTQREGWESELPEAESLLAECEKAFEVWQGQWDTATASLSAASPTPDDVVPVLDAIKDLSSLKKERDDLLHRMTSIENETMNFLKSAVRLIVSIDGEQASPPMESDDTGEMLQTMASKIQTLSDRSKQEAIDAGTRSRLTDEIKEATEALQAETTGFERQKVQLTQLCEEAGGCESGELPEIETRSRERQKWGEGAASAEVNLKRLAGALSVEAFAESMEDVQPGIREDQLKDLDQERDQLAERIEVAQREFGAIELLVSQVNGGVAASDLSQALAFQLGEIGHDAEEYIRLKLASGILRRAIDHYRAENEEPVLKIAKTFFSELSCGTYVDLKVDYDDKDNPILYGVRDEREDVPASRMSKGTADALYLALRLASLEHRCNDGKPMPLIVDDCLQQLDDDRSAAAMKVLSKLSTKMQVIMFTHHDHLVTLAENNLEKDEVHVHRLARN